MSTETVDESEVEADRVTPRRNAVFIVLVSLGALLQFGFLLLLYYAFSTLVSPDLPESEQTRLIAHRFLFAEGRSQILCIGFYVLVACTSLVCLVVHTVVAIAQVPNRRTAFLLTSVGGALLTGLFLTAVLITALRS